MSINPTTRWAEIAATSRFLCVAPHSGYRSTGVDPLLGIALIKPNDSARILGAELRQAFERSRQLSLAECETFFDLEVGKTRYESWVSELLKAGGYRSRKSMFDDMRMVNAILEDGTVILSPLKRERREAWIGLADRSAKVRCSIAQSDEEVGASILLALERCE